MGKKKRGFIRTLGHRAGMEAVKRVVKASSEIGIKYLTLYAFSTENWKRPAEEVNGLMNLLIEYLEREIDELNENDVKLNFIGDLSKIPEKCRIKIKESENITKNNTGLVLNIALNYGGRNEIVNAVKKIGKSLLDGKIKLIDFIPCFYNNDELSPSSDDLSRFLIKIFDLWYSINFSCINIITLSDIIDKTINWYYNIEQPDLNIPPEVQLFRFWLTKTIF